MSKSRVYLAVLAIIFTPVATKAQDFDPEAISQVSKAIAEWKLMNDSEPEIREVYVSSSLSPKAERGISQGINTVSGLSAFGEDYAFSELELQNRQMRFYDFKINLSSTQLNEFNRALETEKTLRLIEKGLPKVLWPSGSWMTVSPIIWFDPGLQHDLKSDIRIKSRSPLQSPGAYSRRKNVVFVDPMLVWDQKFAKSWTPAGPDPQIVVAHEVGHGEFWRRRGYTAFIGPFDRALTLTRSQEFANNTENKFDRSRRATFAIEDRIARDFRQKGYDVTVYGSSYTQERFAVEDKIARDFRQKGYNVMVNKSYEEWRFDRSYQEYRLDPKRYGLSYEIGKLGTNSSIGTYRTGIPMRRPDMSFQQYSNTSLQRYYNKIGAGSSFYVPSYARPRTSYSTIRRRR